MSFLLYQRLYISFENFSFEKPDAQVAALLLLRFRFMKKATRKLTRPEVATAFSFNCFFIQANEKKKTQHLQPKTRKMSDKVSGFMKPNEVLKAPTSEELIRLAKAELAAGIIRQGCGRIENAYDGRKERCQCGGRLPKGERAAEHS